MLTESESIYPKGDSSSISQMGYIVGILGYIVIYLKDIKVYYIIPTVISEDMDV